MAIRNRNRNSDESDTSARPRRPERPKGIFKRFIKSSFWPFLLTALGVVAVCIATILLWGADDLSEFRQGLEQFTMPLLLSRAIVFGLVIWNWDAIVRFVDRRGWVDSLVAKRMYGQGGNLFGVWLLVEVLVIQDLPRMLVGLVGR